MATCGALSLCLLPLLFVYEGVCLQNNPESEVALKYGIPCVKHFFPVNRSLYICLKHYSVTGVHQERMQATGPFIWRDMWIGSMTHTVLLCQMCCQSRLHHSLPALACSDGLRVCNENCQSSLLSSCFTESHLSFFNKGVLVIQGWDTMNWQRRFWSCCRVLWQREAQLAPAIVDSWLI